MKRRLIVLISLFLTAACNPMPGAATPASTIAPAIASADISNATIQYYDISGSTEAELRAELNAKAPVGYDGYKGDATTNWFIRWTWPGYGSSSCDLSAATVTYEIVVTFPRWTPPGDVPPELIAKWNGFARGLAGHEQNHVDFVVDNDGGVVEAISGATCQTADAAATTVLDRIRQLDREYDAATNHGETEGVRFP